MSYIHNGNLHTWKNCLYIEKGAWNIHREPGPHLNIKTIFPMYGDFHIKDKTVGETVLSLTWESLYW